MGDPRGFLKHNRSEPSKAPIGERVKHWREFEKLPPVEEMRRQGARCMDCGVPFCHSGCPLGNYIPDWNDLVFRDRDREAIDRLHATNNFPEVTGRVCPAPCETSCVLGINEPPVAIKQIERYIADTAFENGFVTPEMPTFRTGKRVAVIGSGPSGLAAAQQLNRAGHTVTVYERADRIGGLLRYGIPDFKMEKAIIDRRALLMAAEGVQFETNAEVGRNIEVAWLRREFNAVLIATGSTRPRNLTAPGRELPGIHFAMDFLTRENRCQAGDNLPADATLSAKNKRVVVIGGGDTGSDCVGTSIRQGAASVTQIEILPQPPESRPADNPWPEWPRIMRTSSSQEEGCHREWGVNTTSFEGAGKIERLKLVRVESVLEKGKPVLRDVPESGFTLDADLILLAMGFVGPETSLIEQFGLSLDLRGNIATDAFMAASVPGVFAAGDARRGQSLVVWAITEGRRAAVEIDRYLTLSDSLARDEVFASNRGPAV